MRAALWLENIIYLPLMQLFQDDAIAPASVTPTAAGSDELPVQGTGWIPVEEDALDEQVRESFLPSNSRHDFYIIFLFLWRKMSHNLTFMSGAQGRFRPQPQGRGHASRGSAIPRCIASHVQVMRLFVFTFLSEVI
jgi:hypothetical protein